MEKMDNINKLIINLKVNEQGQTELDFESTETLLKVLDDINNSYPLIRDIIKDRITYDGVNFIINNVKMNEIELKSKMDELNKYEVDKANKKVTNEEEGSYEFDWQKIHNK